MTRRSVLTLEWERHGFRPCYWLAQRYSFPTGAFTAGTGKSRGWRSVQVRIGRTMLLVAFRHAKAAA